MDFQKKLSIDMADSPDARNVMELEPVGKKSAKRKYEKEEDQILNVEHLHRDQKRPSFQAGARRTSREAKTSLNSKHFYGSPVFPGRTYRVHERMVHR